MTNQIKYICSTVFGETDKLYDLIFQYRTKKPHIFNDDMSIYAVKGSFNNLSWCATDFYHSFNWKTETYENETITVETGDMPSMATVINSIQWFNDRGIQTYLELNNSILEDHDVFDRYGNFILRTFQNMGPMNKVIVTSPVLEEYIASEYSDIPIIKNISSKYDLQQFTRLSKIYDGGSINKSFNYSIDMLSQIPLSVIKKIDVSINSHCEAEYLYPEIRQRIYSMRSLFVEEPIEELLIAEDRIPRDNMFGIASISERRELIERSKSSLSAVGIDNFRIESNGEASNILKENIIQFVKPEYQVEAYTEILMDYSQPLIKY